MDGIRTMTLLENGRTFKTVIQPFEQVFYCAKAGNDLFRGKFGKGNEHKGPLVHAGMRHYEVGIGIMDLLPEKQKIYVDGAWAEAVVGIAHAA